MIRLKTALRTRKYLYAFIAICSAPISARAQIVLEFDEFPSGTVITNQYPVATFSSSPGHDDYATEFAGTVTPPNMLCSGSAGIPNCLEDTYVDFPTPISQFTMAAILQNSSSSTVAQFNIFEHGIHTRTEFLMGVGHPDNRAVQFLNLDYMTRLEIVNISARTGWDQMILWQVPEPTSLACLGSGVLLALRRRKR